MKLTMIFALLVVTDISHAGLPHEARYFSMAALLQPVHGMGPVVGMDCELGFKQVGDDCVMANVAFD